MSSGGMEEEVFEVFARKSRGDALAHIGYLTAPDSELARVYAWTTYDEENWFEMCIVPRSAILPVNRTDGPFAGAAAGMTRDQAGSGAGGAGGAGSHANPSESSR